MSTLNNFKELRGEDEKCPLERLRFFCSLALSGQDWIDVEPFFDDIKKLIGEDSNEVRYSERSCKTAIKIQ